MMEHSGTHIDALCHQACDLTLHGGVKVDDVERTDGYRELGAETMKPLLGRGVLLDVAARKAWRMLPQNYAITADDLDACARAAGVDVQPGDVLLVRTGYAHAVERRSDLSERGRRVEVGQHLGGGSAASPRSAPTTWRGTAWRSAIPRRTWRCSATPICW